MNDNDSTTKQDLQNAVLLLVHQLDDVGLLLSSIATRLRSVPSNADHLSEFERECLLVEKIRRMCP